MERDLNRQFTKEDNLKASKSHEKLFNIISHQGNANQNHEIPLHTSKMAIIKKHRQYEV